jgi:hypothetical protein
MQATIPQRACPRPPIEIAPPMVVDGLAKRFPWKILAFLAPPATADLARELDAVSYLENRPELTDTTYISARERFATLELLGPPPLGL